MKKRFNKVRKIFLLAMLCIVAAANARAFEPEYADDARSIRLRWKSGTINLAFSNSLRQSAANIKPGSDITGAIERSLATWERAANIKFIVSWTDKQSISAANGKGDGVSLITAASTAENQAAFAGENAELAGQTRVFYTARGYITEADIVLNPVEQFSTDGSFGTFDFEAALTHEIGHLLGLAHSDIRGATMHAQQAKNGVFSLAAFAPRTLSEDDRAGVRSVYGSRNVVNCCSSITGTLTGANGKPLRNIIIWAEDEATGALAANTEIKPNGIFEISGLRAGKYRVFAQSANDKTGFSARLIGETILKAGEAAELNAVVAGGAKTLELRQVGFNGQLSTLAVPVNPGGSYLIFLGGDFDYENISLGSSSPLISINPSSLSKQDFGAGISVISFQIEIAAEAPQGDYSLYLQTKADERVYLPGCLTIDEMVNEFQTRFLAGE